MHCFAGVPQASRSTLEAYIASLRSLACASLVGKDYNITGGNLVSEGGREGKAPVRPMPNARKIKKEGVILRRTGAL